MMNEGFDQGIQTKKSLPVEIRCLVPPTAKQRERIRAFMAKKYGNEEVELSVIRDPSVGEGFNIFVGDDNYDWTALGRIRQLRRSFQQLPQQENQEDVISLLREDIGKFDLDAADLIAYSHGEYFTLGEKLGKFGFSVKKVK